MDQARRDAYLDALGVTRWRLRRGSDAGDTEAAAVTAVPAPAHPPAAARQAVEPPPSAATVAALGWQALQARVASCQDCALCGSRTQTVFGVGNQHAELMIVGEAPGADEDRQGEPFVGRAGQLLTSMLRAIGLAREDVYIANILKCRPPGNRNPSATEAAACRGYLQRQIALVEPRLILSVGKVSAQNLLGSDAPVGRLRGRAHALPGTELPVWVTYHPAYLLRQPAEKARVWADLQQVALALALPR